MARYLLLFLIVFSGYTITAQSVFTDLHAAQFGDSILIDWTLKGGSTCYDMQLMRSDDSIAFESLYAVGGVCGGTEDQYYSFVDHSGLISGTTYFYKVEASGGTISGETLQITFIDAGKFKLYLYPNPVDGRLTVTVDNRFNPSFLVELYSVQGNLLMRSIENQNLFSIDLGHLAGSPCMLMITTEDGAVFEGQVIVL